MNFAFVLREQLLLAGRSGDEAETNAVLMQLDRLPIDEDILKETGSNVDCSHFLEERERERDARKKRF